MPHVATEANRAELIDRAVAMMASGMSRAGIAKSLGVHVQTVYGWLRTNPDRFRKADQQGAARRLAAGPNARRSFQNRAQPEAPSSPVVTDPVLDGDASKGFEFSPARADAFRPLPGPIHPRDLSVATGCRWPVHPTGDPLHETTTLVCDHPKAHAKTPYCRAHLAMSIGKGSPSEREAHKVLARSA